MNWLEKHRKKIEEMKMPKTIVTVSPSSTCIHPYMFRGNKDVKEIRLPKTVQYIEKTSFRNCTSLEKINLPPQVDYVHEETFRGCVSLKEIIAHNPKPPKCVLNVECYNMDDVLDSVYVPNIPSFLRKKDGKYFEGVDKEVCIIRVPQGSLELYQNAKEWKDFENIVEIW